MRIGLVSYEYPPQQGLVGVGTYMFRLAGTLGRAGHEVHVIAGPSDRAPTRTNFSKMRSRYAAGMPGPVSATSMTIRTGSVSSTAASMQSGAAGASSADCLPAD